MSKSRISLGKVFIDLFNENERLAEAIEEIDRITQVEDEPEKRLDIIHSICCNIYI